MIRVVMVEDSPTQRAVLRRSLEAEGDILVVGEAATADGAVAAVRRGQPDVVTVDLHIPGGGEHAIEQIMQLEPRPILLLSAQLAGMRDEALGAMGAGAAGVLAKPKHGDEAAERTLRTQVRALHGVRPRTKQARSKAPVTPRSMPRPPRLDAERTSTPIIAIAASTGGPAAVTTLLRDLHGVAAPVLLVQHIDPQLTASLADWMARTTGWDVEIAEDRSRLRPGTVHLGPGGRHLGIDASGRILLLDDGAELHRPSADRLFASLAQHAAERTVAAILTGMGNDGAAGLAALRSGGAMTFGQDDRTSAVFGMAKAAVEAGAVRRVLPLDALGAAMKQAVKAAVL
jgi:two-component system chemotaxis response regulator CheB